MIQVLEDYEYSCLDCDRTISRIECETCGDGENYRCVQVACAMNGFGVTAV